MQTRTMVCCALTKTMPAQKTRKRRCACMRMRLRVFMYVCGRYYRHYHRHHNHHHHRFSYHHHHHQCLAKCLQYQQQYSLTVKGCEIIWGQSTSSGCYGECAITHSLTHSASVTIPLTHSLTNSLSPYNGCASRQRQA